MKVRVRVGMGVQGSRKRGGGEHLPPIIKNFRFFLAKRADFLFILPIFCELFL